MQLQHHVQPVLAALFVLAACQDVEPSCPTGSVCIPVDRATAGSDTAGNGAGAAGSSTVRHTNNDCGVTNVDDGFCGTSGTVVNKCTYHGCNSDNDCPGSGFTQCAGNQQVAGFCRAP